MPLETLSAVQPGLTRYAPFTITSKHPRDSAHSSAPAGEERRIARYACGRGTERVGALVGADGYLDHAVELAVIAHIRHHHTRYEALLDAAYDRDAAREFVQPDVLATLSRWGRGAP